MNSFKNGFEEYLKDPHHPPPLFLYPFYSRIFITKPAFRNKTHFQQNYQLQYFVKIH